MKPMMEALKFEHAKPCGESAEIWSHWHSQRMDVKKNVFCCFPFLAAAFVDS